MEFKREKIELDFQKMMDMQQVREYARAKKGTVIFLYPFGESVKQIVNFIAFKVKTNAYNNLIDYGVCRYKCGRSYYHATFFITGQTSRGKIMREKINSGKINVGRKAAAIAAAREEK